jgi:hypothetical protein
VTLSKDGVSYDYEIKVWMEPMDSKTGIAKTELVGC